MRVAPPLLVKEDNMNIIKAIDDTRTRFSKQKTMQEVIDHWCYLGRVRGLAYPKARVRGSIGFFCLDWRG